VIDGDPRATRFRQTDIQGRQVPGWFNTCRLTVARPVDKSLTNDLGASFPIKELASDLQTGGRYWD
jgi:hypothetical protein